MAKNEDFTLPLKTDDLIKELDKLLLTTLKQDLTKIVEN